jgi:hypothetical protein
MISRQKYCGEIMICRIITSGPNGRHERKSVSMCRRAAGSAEKQ